MSLQLSEEVNFEHSAMIDRLYLSQTCKQAELQHGDILLVQRVLPEVHSLLYIQPLTNDCPTFSAKDGVL